MDKHAWMPRRSGDPPAAVAEWGWRYHHLGVPTRTPRTGERYLPELKMFVAGFESNPFGIEWMRFEPGSPVHPLIQALPHLAFAVDDLDRALLGRKILSPASAPSPGVRVAMILSDGAPVELMEFSPSSEKGRG